MEVKGRCRFLLSLGLATLLFASSLGGALLARILLSGEARAYGSQGVGAIRWYFAEGYTGPGFEEWILVFNPPKELGGKGKVAMVRIFYFSNGGFIGDTYIQLEPGERKSVYVNKELERYGYKGDVSVIVSSHENDTPIICERAMYYNYKGIITGGSQSLGYQEAEQE